MAEQPVNYYKTKQPAQLLSNVTQNRISATQNSKKKKKISLYQHRRFYTCKIQALHGQTSFGCGSSFSR